MPMEDTMLIKISQSYREGMSAEKLYDATSVSWVISPGKLEDGHIKYYCAVYDNYIKEVYDLMDWKPDTRKGKERRIILVGKVASTEVRNKLLDINVKELHKGSGNPIKYTSLETLVNYQNGEEEDVNYFWLTAKPAIWSVGEIKDGGEVSYTAFNEEGNKRRIFSAFEKAQPGDKIVFYESTPRKELVALGEVVGGMHLLKENGFNELVDGVSFRYTEDLVPISWERIIGEKRLEKSSPVSNQAQGSLFELTKEEFETILSLQADPLEEEKDDESIEIPSISFAQEVIVEGLHFEERELILKQVKTALANGKHIILTGPPGTGKSKLAKEICHSFGADYIMTTATSDWSTYETIGGYRPNKDGTLSFQQGVFLNCFKDIRTNYPLNKWLIIDEMNRADIDKAFGALFSALTGDPITLSFHAKSGKQLLIRPQKGFMKVTPTDNEYIISNDWRLIGTMNTMDKASLYELSYAFMRRFAFIPVGVPRIIDAEIVDSYLEKWGIYEYKFSETLAFIWEQINKYRQIGPAIIEDLAKYTVDDADFTSSIILYVLPQFEGLLENEILEFVDRVGQLEVIDHYRLLLFAKDFFHIKE
ncbi:MAG: AAA family ATPase [Neobacillus sp.]